MSLRTSRESAAIDSYKAVREREQAIFRAQRATRRWLKVATVFMAVAMIGLVCCAVLFYRMVDAAHDQQTQGSAP